jgi:hypothetical protein
MSDHVGAITPNPWLNLHNEGENTRRLFKQMFILFDRFVYLPQSSDTEDAHKIIAHFAAEDEKEYRSLLSHKPFKQAISNAEDVWSSKELDRFLFKTILLRPKVNEALDHILEKALSDISDEPLPDTERLPAEYRSLRRLYAHTLKSSFLRTDIAFAEMVRKKFRFGGGILTNEHKTIIELFGAIEALSGMFPEQVGYSTKVMAPSVLEGFTMPDFGALSWNQIFDLRSDRFVHEFRTKVGETMRFTRTEYARNVELAGQVAHELWRLAEEVQPPPLWQRIGKIGLSLLHVPPFDWIGPVIHAAMGGAELLEDSDRKKSFGWLFFVSNARKLASEHGGPDTP